MAPLLPHSALPTCVPGRCALRCLTERFLPSPLLFFRPGWLTVSSALGWRAVLQRWLPWAWCLGWQPDMRSSPTNEGDRTARRKLDVVAERTHRTAQSQMADPPSAAGLA